MCISEIDGSAADALVDRLHSVETEDAKEIFRQWLEQEGVEIFQNAEKET